MKRWFQKVLDGIQLYFVYRLDADTVTRALAFLGTLGVMLYLYATGKNVPDPLLALVGLFAGYYFRDAQIRNQAKAVSFRDRKAVN